MPHVAGGSSSPDADLASSDEIKVFSCGDEGDGAEEKSASSDVTPEINELNQLKNSLIDEGENERSKGRHHRQEPASTPSGYIPPSVSSSANKVSAMVGGTHPGSPLSFMMHHNMDGYLQPPPAHMGIVPSIDPKTGSLRPPIYPLAAGGQYHHPVFPDLAQQMQWHSPYHAMTSSAFRAPYHPGTMPSVSSAGFGRGFAAPSFIPPYHVPGLSSVHHPFSFPGKSEFAAAMAASLGHHHGLNQSHHLESNGRLSLSGHYPHGSFHTHSPHHGSSSNLDQKPPSSLSRLSNGSSVGRPGSPSGHSANHSVSSPGSDCKPNGKHGGHLSNDKHGGHGHGPSTPPQQHVKKPLNAFMLYMKEMRTKVVAEYTLKESAAINQILGKKWHNLSRDEQAKYYDLARKERQLHMELYPGWTARDNYAINQKKKKKKRDKSSDGEGGSLKKCRARWGLDQQSQWCKPCRRKKKCIRWADSADHNNDDGDNLGSVGSVEAPTPDSKSANESDPDHPNYSPGEMSLSSPPVPSQHSGDYIIPHHLHLSNGMRTSSQISHSSSAAAMVLACPPRNSPIGPNNPLSVEQLIRPHCPPR